MSKNIAIQEGGTGRQFTADKLKTSLVGGGTCEWVPEDEVRLGTKRITASGTYAAEDDGCYGYSQVVVNVPGSAGGSPGGIGSAVQGIDGDGDERIVSIDERGSIVSEKIPSSIVVTTLPNQTVWGEGANMLFDGIVVKAYMRSGALWTGEGCPDGAIPFDDLVFPVTVAPPYTGDEPSMQSDLDITPFTQPIEIAYFDASAEIYENGAHIRTTTLEIGDYDAITLYRVGDRSIAIIRAAKTRRSQYDAAYTYAGKTVYAPYSSYGIPVGWYFGSITPDAGNGEIYDSIQAHSIYMALAWTMIYGDVKGGAVAIPVRWTCPANNVTYETTFSISVVSAGGGGDE